MERKLKLVKNESKSEDQPAASRLTDSVSHPVGDSASHPVGDHASRLALLPPLTSAERAEAVRFRALTATKAARQARLRRMMAQLNNLDEVSPAA